MKNIKTVGSLFFVTAFVLAVFGGASFSRALANPIYNLYAVLMFVDAAVMLVCGLYINRHTQAVYWFAVMALTLNIVLTIFDQIGLVDILFAALNFVTLMALVSSRKEFSHQ